MFSPQSTNYWMLIVLQLCLSHQELHRVKITPVICTLYVVSVCLECVFGYFRMKPNEINHKNYISQIFLACVNNTHDNRRKRTVSSTIVVRCLPLRTLFRRFSVSSQFLVTDIWLQKNQSCDPNFKKSFRLRLRVDHLYNIYQHQFDWFKAVKIMANLDVQKKSISGHLGLSFVKQILSLPVCFCSTLSFRQSLSLLCHRRTRTTALNVTFQVHTVDKLMTKTALSGPCGVSIFFLPHFECPWIVEDTRRVSSVLKSMHFVMAGDSMLQVYDIERA